MSRRVYVFDDLAWRRAGRDDNNGNAQFWRPARVLRAYKDAADHTVLVDVDFGERISTGHYADGIRLRKPVGFGRVWNRSTR